MSAMDNPTSAPRLKMRVYFELLGDHAHLSIFVGRNLAPGSLGLAGKLVMRVEEFAEWRGSNLAMEFIYSKNTVKDEHTTAVPARDKW